MPKEGNYLPELLITRADAADLPVLLMLEHTAFSEPWGEGALATQLHNPNGITLLAREEAGEAVGYLAGSVLPPEGELYRIVTHPACRRQGIGEKIMYSFFDICSNIGADVLFLEVRSSNLPALSLYRKLGFLPVGTRKKYYRNPQEDALVLRRG